MCGTEIAVREWELVGGKRRWERLFQHWKSKSKCSRITTTMACVVFV
jgi:hypothetical protein